MQSWNRRVAKDSHLVRPRCSQSSGPTQPSSASLTTREVYQVYRHYTISLDAPTIQDCAGLAVWRASPLLVAWWGFPTIMPAWPPQSWFPSTLSHLADFRVPLCEVRDGWNTEKNNLGMDVPFDGELDQLIIVLEKYSLEIKRNLTCDCLGYIWNNSQSRLAWPFQLEPLITWICHCRGPDCKVSNGPWYLCWNSKHRTSIC